MQEKTHRKRWQAAYERHESFWHENNTIFASQLHKAQALSKHSAISFSFHPLTFNAYSYLLSWTDDPSVMADFYRSFAKERADAHREYTMWWWRENFILLKLSAQVNLHRWMAMILGRPTSSSPPSSSSSYFTRRDS
jgi:hypothetical protein